MRTSSNGVDFIKKHEALRLKAYKCPGGKWTIGWGHTGDVKEGDCINEHQAEAILDVDIDTCERALAKLLDVPVTQSQYDALISFVFNLGEAALARSTLLKKLNAGDERGAAAEFMKWRYAAGKVMPGLVKRRAEERTMFLSEVPPEKEA